MTHRETASQYIPESADVTDISESSGDQSPATIVQLQTRIDQLEQCLLTLRALPDVTNCVNEAATTHAPMFDSSYQQHSQFSLHNNTNDNYDSTTGTTSTPRRINNTIQSSERDMNTIGHRCQLSMSRGHSQQDHATHTHTSHTHSLAQVPVGSSTSGTNSCSSRRPMPSCSTIRSNILQNPTYQNDSEHMSTNACSFPAPTIGNNLYDNIHNNASTDLNSDSSASLNMTMFDAGVAADLVPHVSIVSPSIRRDIIAGKDINLSALLIPGYKTDVESTRHLMVGVEAIPLMPLTDS